MLEMESKPRWQDASEAKATTVQAPANLLGWLPIAWTQLLFPGTAPPAGPIAWRSFALLFVMSGVLLYPCMSFHLFEPDEGRYAQIPREMLERGEWVVPTLQGQPYLDKPPLFYWLVMLSYSVFGYHEFAARLVPAFAMHGSVLLCYVLGRRMLGERAAFFGAILLTVSPLFLGVGRLLTLDGLLTFWIVVASLSAYLAQNEGRLKRTWWFIAAMACALGVLTKGPVAVLLVIPPLLVHRRLVTSAPISWRAWGCFFVAVALVNLPWYLAVCVERPEFASYFLWRHNVQRFVEPFDHVQPVWFFVPIILYGLLPALVMAWPLWRFMTSTQDADAQKRGPGMGYMLLCGCWCVFFFSLSGSKLPTYVLPAFPTLCLALGCFVANMNWARSRWYISVITACWLLQAAANYFVIPAYAHQRSPVANVDVMRAYCGDANVPVVCFPRSVDSVAFMTGRNDFKTFRSKDVASCVDELKKAPRTVVLFGHRNSPKSLALQLPANLRMVERRPMGLCEMAVIERIDKKASVRGAARTLEDAPYHFAFSKLIKR